MKYLLCEMLRAFIKGDYEEAERLFEKIIFEYDILNDIINKNSYAYFDTLRVLNNEIARLERENKDLKLKAKERN